MAKFKHPARALRHRKDLEAVRDVGIERVDSSNSEALFAFLSLFVNRKTVIDTLTATRGSNELDDANEKKDKKAYRRSANETHATWKKKNKHLIKFRPRKGKKDMTNPSYGKEGSARNLRSFKIQQLTKQTRCRCSTPCLDCKPFFTLLKSSKKGIPTCPDKGVYSCQDKGDECKVEQVRKKKSACVTAYFE